MFWYPYTGSVPYALTWSASLFTTGLAVAGLVGAVRVAWLALRAAREESNASRAQAVSVPFEPAIVDDAPDMKQDAA